MLRTARSGQPGRAPFCSRVYKLAGITPASVGGAGDDPAVAIATDKLLQNLAMARGVLSVAAVTALLAAVLSIAVAMPGKEKKNDRGPDFRPIPHFAKKPQFDFNDIGKQFRGFLQFNERPKRRFRRHPSRKCRTWPPRTRSYDGNCNHVHRHDLGRASTPFKLIGRTPLNGEMVGEDRPNTRVISNTIHDDDEKPGNHRKLSELVTFFGQFIDHVVTETENEKESAPITIPVNDTVFASGVIPFFRTRKEKTPRGYSPVNLLSSFIDASNVYGETEEKAKPLRSNKDGKLRMDPGNFLPKDKNGFYISGDRRANENPALTSLHTLFFREHNRVCDELKKAFPWRRDDEWLYHMARKIVGAEMQSITYHEFLPAVTGRKLPWYRGYKSWVDPRVSNEFSTVGYRVGHTLINKDITSIRGGKRTTVKLRDAFFQPAKFIDLTMEGLLLGAARTQAAEVDHKITAEVRNFLLNGPGGALRLDLAALNIQRGRDHAVPSYNEMRKAYGLWPVKSFKEITSKADLAARLEKLYMDVNQVDAWTGGLCEDHERGSSLGPLYLRIWQREFQRIRDGDRFYYEQRNMFMHHMQWRVPTIRRLLSRHKGGIMQKIIVDNTGLSAAEVKRNPFHA